jgi:hypothetical protein
MQHGVGPLAIGAGRQPEDVALIIVRRNARRPRRAIKIPGCFEQKATITQSAVGAVEKM